jgi:hypothetical protein
MVWLEPSGNVSYKSEEMSPINAFVRALEVVKTVLVVKYLLHLLLLLLAFRCGLVVFRVWRVSPMYKGLVSDIYLPRGRFLVTKIFANPF